jgi:predicted nicotinamide N-methyase
MTNDDIGARLNSVAHELADILCLNNIGLKLRLAANEAAQWRISELFQQGPHENSTAMWAHAYRGGLAIAEYIVNHAADFAGKNVLDIGTGCGIAALAAAKAKAKVVATDSSAFAVHMAGVNAELNGLSIRTAQADFMKDEDLLPFYRDADIITAADVTMRDYRSGNTFQDSIRAMFDRAKRLEHFVSEGKMVFFASQDIHHQFAFQPEVTLIQDLDPERRSSVSMAKATRRQRAPC